MIIATNEYLQAKRLLREALDVFCEYEMISLKVEVLRLLLNPVFKGVIKQKEARKLRDDYEKSNLQAFCLNQTHLIVYDINALYGKTEKKNYLEKLEDRVNRLEELWESSQLTTVYNQYVKAQELILQAQGQWQILLEVLNHSEKLVEAGKLSAKLFDLNRIRNMKTFTLTMVKQYEAAINYAQKQLKYFEKEEYNYYLFQLNHALALIYAKRYKQVIMLVKELEKSRNWKMLIASYKEQFYLIRAYARFFSGEPINYNDLYNRMVKLRRNSLGVGISMRILELLIDFKSQNIDAFERKLKNLQTSLYSQTKVKKQTKTRTNRFLLLLWKVVKYRQLSMEEIKEKSRYLYKRLSKQAFEG
ncbi:MAG: hypothetical protein AAF734_12310, partial [Bacteroidota bacterium]